MKKQIPHSPSEREAGFPTNHPAFHGRHKSFPWQRKDYFFYYYVDCSILKLLNLFEKNECNTVIHSMTERKLLPV